MKCIICGKELEGGKTKFCSNSCKCKYFHQQHPDKCNRWNKAKLKVNNNCKVCGKECGRKIYCSQECKPKLISVPSLPIHRRVIEIFNVDCYVCQKLIFKIDVHHKDGNHNNNLKSNLIPLCPSCHHKVHTPKLKQPKYSKNKNMPMKLRLNELKKLII